MWGTCNPMLNGNPYPPPTGTYVQPGDTLTCESGESLQIIATKPNQKIYEATFS